MSSVKKFFNTIKGKPKKNKNSVNNNNNNISNNNSSSQTTYNDDRPKLTEEQITQLLLKRGPSKSGRYKVANKKRSSLDVTISRQDKDAADNTQNNENFEIEFDGHEVAEEIGELARQISLQHDD